jgi:HK97 family phage major capsid protein
MILKLEEINARLREIQGEIETRGDNITAEDAEDLTAFETEVNSLIEERNGILAAAERRQGILAGIAAGNTDAAVIARMGAGGAIRTQPPDGGGEVPDRFDTPQYRKHFMEFMCRGTPIPAEFRADALTTTGDVGAVIPTTIMNEIIKEATTYGHLFSRVRRLNIQGGVSFPILSLVPTASWITETTVSDTQKLQANTSITFNYYGLECRIAQTLLVSVVSLAEFQRLFVPLAAEAMVKAIEIGIIKGTGTGQMLGVLNETRIPAVNTITMTPAEFAEWTEWKKKVFAKMKISYRAGSFIMAQGTFDGYIDGMVDSTGQPIGRVNYGIDNGETYRFGGRPIITVEDAILPAYEDAAAGDVVAVFMRLSDYAINTNMQMRMVHWTDHDTNQLKNKCIMILDGKVIDPHGILLIKKGGTGSG